MNQANLRGIITDSLRYWERLRLYYNLLLSGITLSYIIPVAWRRPEGINLQDSLPALLLLALAANILYCTAYIPDVFVQISTFRSLWRRWRWLLFLLGCVVAVFFTTEIASTLALLV